MASGSLALTAPRMNSHVQDVMLLLGWNEKAFVPIASEENRQLMDAIRQLQHERERQANAEEQLRDRVVWLKQHVDNSGSDIQRNLKLIDAHRCQFESEDHMSRVAGNEEAARKKEMHDLDRSFDELKRLSTFIEDELEKVNGKIDCATSDIHWMKIALNEWNEANKNGEHVMAIMEQLSKDDAKQAHKLETIRRNIQTDIVRQRGQLNEAYEEQKALEKILDNTARLYSQTHLERQELVFTWRRAVAELHARERAIRDTIEEIEVTTKRTERKRDELYEQDAFLGHQLRNNREAEEAIAEINGRAVALRTQNSRAVDAVATQTNEVLTLKKMVRSIGHQLQRARQQTRHLMRNVDEKSRHIEAIKDEERQLEAKVHKFADLNATAQDRLRNMDEFVEAEEKCIHNLNLEIGRMATALYRSQQILQQWERDFKLLQSEINVLETTIKAMNHRHGVLQKDIKHQTEIMYDVQYRLFDIENRIAKMKGITVEVNPETVAKLAGLEQRYGQMLQQNKLVHGQVAELQANIRKLQTLLEHDTADHVKLGDKRKERQLYLDGAIKQLAKARDVGHENLVENSLVRMRLHQMEQRHQRLMGNAFNLERHRCELELAINERLLSIQAEASVLGVRKKVLLEERSQLRADVADRRRAIDGMVVRFELASQLLGRTDNGQVVNTVQLRIQAAQEKELLLDQGSSLNDKVIAAERDISALENTLIMMNYSNDKYQRGMELVPEIDEEEQAEWTALNNQLAQSQNNLKNLKANTALKSRMITDIRAQCSDIDKELENIRHSRIDSSDDLMKIHNEIYEQKSKRERAERELKTVRKTVTQKIGDRTYLTNFEKDIKARELEERNTLALQQLSDMADSVIGLGPVVTKHLYEKGLQMPPLTGSSAHSDSMRPPSDGSRRNLRRQSQCSNGSLSAASSQSEAVAKSERTLEKRASVVTLDFQGDESVRSFKLNRSQSAIGIGGHGNGPHQKSNTSKK